MKGDKLCQLTSVTSVHDSKLSVFYNYNFYCVSKTDADPQPFVCNLVNQTGSIIVSKIKYEKSVSIVDSVSSLSIS